MSDEHGSFSYRYIMVSESEQSLQVVGLPSPHEVDRMREGESWWSHLFLYTFLKLLGLWHDQNSDKKVLFTCHCVGETDAQQLTNARELGVDEIASFMWKDHHFVTFLAVVSSQTITLEDGLKSILTGFMRDVRNLLFRYTLIPACSDEHIIVEPERRSRRRQHEQSNASNLSRNAGAWKFVQGSSLDQCDTFSCGPNVCWTLIHRYCKAIVKTLRLPPVASWSPHDRRVNGLAVFEFLLDYVRQCNLILPAGDPRIRMFRRDHTPPRLDAPVVAIGDSPVRRSTRKQSHVAQMHHSIDDDDDSLEFELAHDGVCVMCCEAFEPGERHVLPVPCKCHPYHTGCFFDMLDSFPTCALCQKRLKGSTSVRVKHLPSEAHDSPAPSVCDSEGRKALAPDSPAFHTRSKLPSNKAEKEAAKKKVCCIVHTFR